MSGAGGVEEVGLGLVAAGAPSGPVALAASSREMKVPSHTTRTPFLGIRSRRRPPCKRTSSPASIGPPVAGVNASPPPRFFFPPVLNLGRIFGFWKLAFQLGRRSCIWGFLSQTPQLSNCLIMGCLSCFNGSYSQLSGNPSLNTGKGKNCDGQVTYGFCLVKGKADHPMEDYHVAKFVDIQEHELGFFAIFDGHLGHGVPSYLQKHLFQNILKEGEFWTDPGRSISKAYEKTDQAILSDTSELARGGSTAVTAILMNGRKLWIGNVGDSRAVLSKRGQAIQMTTDHDPNAERGSIENTGGFVSNMPGDVPRVNGQLAVSRAFGDKNLKTYIRADPDVCDAIVDASTDFLILASDGLWKVMGNQDAVDIARKIRDPQKAAKQLTAEALKKDSKDDISCVVVRFR